MLRDYLNLEASDRLEKQGGTGLTSVDQANMTSWRILTADGQPKGTVMLFDKISTRRSWPAEYRLTQRDTHGKVVLDKLLDTSPLGAA
ncbi:hypothetical protein N4G40_07320 [Pantoea eucrina]|uniref:Uncharacterized protein n=1 Tax=Pantoea eucrina TaxID=472693 RepID=A0ABU5LDP8_9GAMM|nr:hypothetical protein [Pantoea eucrina]MDZ7278083.1 hypothetical protein [Pantoea eucrina]